MDISVLVGQTFNKVTQNGEDEITFDNKYRLYHKQQCCENVTIEDVVGNLSDLENSPILQAEVSTNLGGNDRRSETWTFYKFATVKGYVTIRWYGTSNGYYSEEVNFETIQKEGEFGIVSYPI